MKKKHLDPNWIDFILENCDNVGISRQIIEQFIKEYLYEQEEL